MLTKVHPSIDRQESALCKRNQYYDDQWMHTLAHNGLHASSGTVWGVGFTCVYSLVFTHTCSANTHWSEIGPFIFTFVPNQSHTLTTFFSNLSANAEKKVTLYFNILECLFTTNAFLISS